MTAFKIGFHGGANRSGLNVSPRGSLDYPGNILPGNSELLGNPGSAQPTTKQQTDSSDVAFTQLGAMAEFPGLAIPPSWCVKDSVSMSHVFTASYILKVFDAIVAFYSVLVVHLMTWRARPQKCLGYDAMHKKVPRTAFTQTNLNVGVWSLVHSYGFHDVTPPNSAVPVSGIRQGCPGQRTHIAKAAGLIKPFVSRYVSPFFIHCLYSKDKTPRRKAQSCHAVSFAEALIDEYSVFNSLSKNPLRDRTIVLEFTG